MPKKTPFYADRPVFVKKPFNSGGRMWRRGEEFVWLTRKVSASKVETLYRQNFLYHDQERVVEKKLGDGLDAMNIDELHNVVKEINIKVKANTASQTEYDRKKCKTSRIKGKQMGLIRTWRNTYGYFESL